MSQSGERSKATTVHSVLRYRSAEFDVACGGRHTLLLAGELDFASPTAPPFQSDERDVASVLSGNDSCSRSGS